MTKPFLKWAGSKQKLLSFLRSHIPEDFNTYVEPFLGSGALFFDLAPSRAILSDANQDLIKTFQAVRDNPQLVEKHIASLSTDVDKYYEVRRRKQLGRFQRAADFIYLNKLCWNGLYRVNLKGHFNVPYGRNKTGTVVHKGQLVQCATLLAKSNVRIEWRDFADTLEETEKGDFVFLDPPYVTSHNNNGFIEYNEDIFSWNDQVRLAEACDSLASRGVHVLVTNANHDAVRKLYPGFEAHTIERSSTLASNSVFRRNITELALVRRA